MALASRGQAGQRLPYHLIFVCGPLEHALGPLDIEKDVGKDPDGILVATHHQISKTNVIVCGDLALRHTRIHALWEGVETSAVSPKANLSQIGSESQRGLVSAEGFPAQALNYQEDAHILEPEALSADCTIYC